jgi:hypothetical protein
MQKKRMLGIKDKGEKILHLDIKRKKTSMNTAFKNSGA